MSLLFYKRPNYVDHMPGRMDPVEYERLLEKSRKAIPSELSFDMVVSNRALPPCSLRDFMDYLLYVSHTAENLQFYLWLQDYRQRFNQASRYEQALSPPWTEEMLSQQGLSHADPGPVLPEKTMAQVSEMTTNLDNYDVPLKALGSVDESGSFLSGSARTKGTMQSVEYANEQTGLKWQSFTIQPFRAEVNRIISHYIAPGAPRELNLSHKNRTACLHALQHTTHPTAFQIPASIATETLRNHSHPNFIRWSSANGNRPRILFGRILGALNILFGFLIAIFLLLSSASRWWRLCALPAWFLGFAFLLAGANGICLVLYVTHDRHMRPWEQFSNDSDSTLDTMSSKFSPDASRSPSAPYNLDPLADDQATLTANSDRFSLSQPDTASSTKNPDRIFGIGSGSGSNRNVSADGAGSGGGVGGGRKAHVALEAFGTANAYGHEVWMDRYRAKMMLRKIFDRTVWVSNEHLRLVQDKVALQAILWSVIVSVPLTVVFVAVPRVGAYH